MTTLGQFLDEARAIYVRLFASKLAQLNESNTNLLVEPVLRAHNGEMISEGILNLPMRVDVAQIQIGKTARTFRIDSEQMLNYEPAEIQWDEQLSVLVGAFCWDDLKVTLLGDYTSNDLSRVRDWFFEWFDEGDKNLPAENGLHNVVHFLSDPISNEGRTKLEIDLGSASVTAFEGLLDALSSCGVSKIYVGSISASA